MAANIIGLESAIKTLRGSSKAAVRAGRSAVNKVARQERNDAIKLTKEHTSIKASVIRKNISMKLAKQGETKAEIIPTKKRIGIKDYQPTFVRLRKTRIAVMADISFRRGRQVVSRRVFRSPKRGGGVKRIFFREPGVSRLPLKTATGPSMNHHFQYVYKLTRLDIAKAIRREFLLAWQRERARGR